MGESQSHARIVALVTDIAAPPPSVTRQEKEPASEEVTEVAPGVLRMQLPIALPGLAHINTYAIVGKQGIAIVDPGLPGPKSWKALETRLKSAGLKTKHVSHVLITHSHPDHFGNAGRLAKESDAAIVTHRAFRLTWNPNSAHQCTMDDDCDDPEHAHPDAGQEALPAPRADFGATPPWGGDPFIPSMKKGVSYRILRSASNSSVLGRFFPMPKPAARLRNNDAVRLGDRDWFAVHTPGHTLDHLCLWNPEDGTFISGDHVLPTITPHISGIGTGRDSLGSFFTSLDLVAALPGVRNVLPAHGHPFTDLAGRCNDIKEHHHERLDRLRKAFVSDGASTVEDFSHHLFRKERWGSMASSETYAHLVHLEVTGKAERQTDGNGVAHFEIP